ncbi:MAG: hypothetical protein ACOX3X_04810 [Eubacteriales bacterium]
MSDNYMVPGFEYYIPEKKRLIVSNEYHENGILGYYYQTIDNYILWYVYGPCEGTVEYSEDAALDQFLWRFNPNGE